MPSPAYYVVVFTARSWHHFKAGGGTTAGFPSQAWGRAAKLKIGDYLLCYLVDVKLWIGILQVVGAPYISSEPPIWGIDVFPARVPVKMIDELDEDCGVPAKRLVQQIPSLKAAADKHPGAWGGFLRGSPRKWSAEDAKVVINAIRHQNR